MMRAATATTVTMMEMNFAMCTNCLSPRQNFMLNRHVDAHAHIYIYTHIHTHTHTYIYIYIYIELP